eukprot:813010-Rhodomonas_salina.4
MNHLVVASVGDVSTKYAISTKVLAFDSGSWGTYQCRMPCLVICSGALSRTASSPSVIHHDLVVAAHLCQDRTLRIPYDLTPAKALGQYRTSSGIADLSRRFFSAGSSRMLTTYAMLVPDIA